MTDQNECTKIILKDKDGNHLISVDYFKAKNNAKYQFLTHAHRVDAITETWIKPIYCSRETAKILPALTRGSSGTGIRSRFLRLLEVGQTHKLEKGLQVTVFDSNHCYGSVMYLFEGQKLEVSPVLCTGHFKADSDFFNRFDQSYQYEMMKNLKINTVYFDNKNILDDNFLTKTDVINGIVSLATRHPLAVCLLPLHSLGKEDVLESISNTLNECVELDDTRFQIYQIRSTFESVLGNFIEPSVNSVRIRSIPRNGRNLNDYLKNSSIANYIICDVSHSDTYESITPSANYARFRYTEHSTRSEIFEFLRRLRFENIIPIAAPLKLEDRNIIMGEQAEKELLLDESTLFAPPVLNIEAPAQFPYDQTEAHLHNTETRVKSLPSDMPTTSDIAIAHPTAPTQHVSDMNSVQNPAQTSQCSIMPPPNTTSTPNPQNSLPGPLRFPEQTYSEFYQQPSTSASINHTQSEDGRTFYNNEYYNLDSQAKPCLSSWDSSYSEEQPSQRPVIILSREPIQTEEYYETTKYYGSHENEGMEEYLPIQLEDGEEVFISEDGMAEFFVPENMMLTDYVEPSTTNGPEEFRIPEVPPHATKQRRKRQKSKREDGQESVGEVVKANTKMLRLLEKIDREKAAAKSGESVLRRLSENENLNPSSRSIFRKEGCCIHNISHDGICVDCILPAFDVNVLSPKKRNALKSAAPLECGVRKKRCPNPSIF